MFSIVRPLSAEILFKWAELIPFALGSSLARWYLVSSVREQIEEYETERLSGKGCEWSPMIGWASSFLRWTVAYLRT